MAEDEARRLGHDYIGTEHVLLGLIREGQGIAARVLESRNIREGAVRAHVRRIVGEGPGQTSDRFPFAPQAKKALQLATREAVEGKHGWIGTEHILLGVVGEDSVGARILADLGSPPGAVAADVRAVLGATK